MENLQWKIGDVEIYQIVEIFDDKLFSTFIPEAKPEKVLSVDWLKQDYVGEQGSLKAQIQSFIIKSNGKNILIDTCNGNHKNRPTIPEWSNLNTNFLDKFDRLGMKPEQIDYVVCTHLHFDHVGWNTVLENGTWVPTFKNAKYLISQGEYDYWIQKPEKEMVDDFNGFDDSIVPIVEAKLAQFITDDFILDSNISFIPTPGHTPHHISVLVSSQKMQAIITGDVMHHPCQIVFPDWTTLADTYPDATIETRRKFLERYADTGALIIGSHFPCPVAGYIEYRDGEYTFKGKL